MSLVSNCYLPVLDKFRRRPRDPPAAPSSQYDDDAEAGNKGVLSLGLPRRKKKQPSRFYPVVDFDLSRSSSSSTATGDSLLSFPPPTQLALSPCPPPAKMHPRVFAGRMDMMCVSAIVLAVSKVT